MLLGQQRSYLMSLCKGPFRAHRRIFVTRADPVHHVPLLRLRWRGVGANDDLKASSDGNYENELISVVHPQGEDTLYL